jgi:hypothetical protein
MNWLVVVVLLMGAAAGAAALFVRISSAGFEAHIKQLRLELARTQSEAESERLAEALPAIVRAYAEKAGGQVGALQVIHATQTAELSPTRTGKALALSADQWTGLLVTGFVWRASAKMSGLPVTVLDAYVAGSGEFSVRPLGSVAVGGGVGPDYDKGELMRYLSELPIYPDAILNNMELAWRIIDALTVEVSALSGSGPASVRFTFDRTGDIVGLEADDRPMTGADGISHPTPWKGLYGRYQQFGGYRLPSYGEVGWVLPDGLFTYWRGTLVIYEVGR